MTEVKNKIVTVEAAKSIYDSLNSTIDDIGNSVVYVSEENQESVLTGKIMDFFADKAKTIPAFPRTKVKAVSNDDGVGLDALLNGINTSLNSKADKTELNNKVNNTDIINIAHGGTGSSNGATGLNNLFAAGNTILSSYQYGTTLPSTAPAGRIFFKKVSS